MDSLAAFCENVTILRTHYGYSKKQMAQLLGIGVGSLRKIESGEIPPRLKVDVIFAVCEQFHIRPSALFPMTCFRVIMRAVSDCLYNMIINQEEVRILKQTRTAVRCPRFL